MTRKTLRTTARPGVVGILFALLSGVLLTTGCSDDDPVPVCDACDRWTQISAGLGRYPTPHPSASARDFVVYSTIEKDPNASDGDLQTDEDLWLAWVLDPTDPTQNITYQLTFDDLGPGDNFYPRWSPSGTQLAWVHADPGGVFEIWRMTVGLPTGPTDPPDLGVPELVVADARDPAWLTDTRMLFTRLDKLYQVDLPAARGTGGGEVQLTFNPPSYTSTDDYIDRHPDASLDAEAIFNTTGRQNVADLYVEAYEIDHSVDPPDTTIAQMSDGRGAWISFQSPAAPGASYPIFEGADTLRTPALLKSVPVGEGGNFRVGFRIDTRFLPEADSTREVYCDTTIITQVPLLPGDLDTLKTYFRVARSSLGIASGLPNTAISWTRQDLRESNDDFGGINPFLSNSGDVLVYNCVLVHGVRADGVPDVNTLETFIVTGQAGAYADTIFVTGIDPGTSRLVTVLPTGSAVGTLVFDDAPAEIPEVTVIAYEAGTTTIASFANSTNGAFEVPRLLGGFYDLEFTSALYETTIVNGVEMVEDEILNQVADVDLGAVTMNVRPLGSISGDLAFSNVLSAPWPVVEIIAFTAGTTDSVKTVTTSDADSSFVVDRLLPGDYDLTFNAEGYVEESVDDVTVLALTDTPVGTQTLVAEPGNRPTRFTRFDARSSSRGSARAVRDAAAPEPRVIRADRALARSRGASLSELFRAPGDFATLWRIRPVDGEPPELTEVLGSTFALQSPAVTDDLGGGAEDVRYVAYITDEPGYWELRVQRLRDWAVDGSPYVVPTPGTIDNLACSRNVFHPRWRPDSIRGDLRLLVALTDCPDNGFENLGTDDNPWATGELRIWEVVINDYP